VHRRGERHQPPRCPKIAGDLALYHETITSRPSAAGDWARSFPRTRPAYGGPEIFPRRMSSRHSGRVCPVCSIQTSTCCSMPAG
jgi:hypothetical protein